MQYEELKARCDETREELLSQETIVRALKQEVGDHSMNGPAGLHDKSEVMANLTLAIRHLEDARMRLGKAIQHGRDGVSIFDQGKRPNS